MKIILEFSRDATGKVNKSYLSFDKEGMECLRELLGPPTFEKKHDDVHMFSESWGTGDTWGPPLSDESYFEGCEVIDNLELNYLGDTEESEARDSKKLNNNT